MDSKSGKPNVNALASVVKQVTAKEEMPLSASKLSMQSGKEGVNSSATNPPASKMSQISLVVPRNSSLSVAGNNNAKVACDDLENEG
jgi:hypothetical protein